MYKIFGIALINLLLIQMNFGQTKDSSDSEKFPEIIFSSSMVDVTPSYAYGPGFLSKFIKDSLKIPESAYNDTVSGTIEIQFVIDTNGNINNVKLISDSLGHGLDLEAERVLLLTSGQWLPALKLEKAVKCYSSLKIEVSAIRNQTYAMHDVEVFPDINKGYNSIHHFLNENINYPKAALENETSGTVIVQFTVCKDGSICNVSTLYKTLGFGLEEEAIRIVNMTNGLWTPAKVGDEEVNVRFQLPIRFLLY